MKAQQLTVGIGALIARDGLLVVRRHLPEVPEYDNKWELPGGKIEIGEPPEAAIEREVYEETGVRATCQEILPFSYTRLIRTAKGNLHVIVLCGKCSLATPVPAGEEHEVALTSPEAEWIRIQGLPFDQIIPGSREFVIWCLHTTHPDLIPIDAALYKMELESVSPEENKYRRYTVIISFDPENRTPYTVRRAWGRIGDKSKGSSEKRFRRMDQALAFAQEVIEDRKRHNYRLTFIHDNHPLRSWLGEIAIEHSEDTAKRRQSPPSLF